MPYTIVLAPPANSASKYVEASQALYPWTQENSVLQGRTVYRISDSGGFACHCEYDRFFLMRVDKQEGHLHSIKWTPL